MAAADQSAAPLEPVASEDAPSVPPIGPEETAPAFLSIQHILAERGSPQEITDAKQDGCLAHLCFNTARKGTLHAVSMGAHEQRGAGTRQHTAAPSSASSTIVSLFTSLRRRLCARWCRSSISVILRFMRSSTGVRVIIHAKRNDTYQCHHEAAPAHKSRQTA